MVWVWLASTNAVTSPNREENKGKDQGERRERERERERSEMHSAVQRANAVATFSAILLAALCAGASFLDSFNSPSVQAHVQVCFPISTILNLISIGI
jgi:hypothetical protein